MKKFKKVTIYICSFMVLLFSCKSTVFGANQNCTVESAEQLAKIIYREVGAPLNSDFTEDAFGKFTTAAVVLNNASRKSGSTMYEKLLNLTSNNYQSYSSYRDKSFESVVDPAYRSKMLYIAECVLNGDYTLPSNITLQASQDIVNRYGTVWEVVRVNTGIGMDTYFGYEKGRSLSSVDVYGKTVPSSPVYYKNLAANLLSENYSTVTTKTVCNGTVDTSSAVSSASGEDSDYETVITDDAGYYGKVVAGKPRKTDNRPPCERPGLLKALNIILTVIDILKVLAPVLVVIAGIVDFTKAFLGGNELKDSVKRLITKFVIAFFIFIIPSLLIAGANFVSEFTHSNIKIDECINNAKKINN